MTALQQALHELRALKIPLNPPATAENLTHLEGLVSQVLPTELRELYLDHNGHELTFDPDIDDGDVVGLPFRLLSISELSRLLIEQMRQDWFAEYPDLLDQLLPCWSDDNGNYMVLYIAGSLTGRIAYLDHELGFNVRPEFKNLPTYYASIIQAAQANSYDIATDYPTLQDDADQDARDTVAFEYCLSQYRQAQDEHRQMFYAYNALYLCPFARTNDLYELLADEGKYVQGEVCQILAARNWSNAITRLGHVALARRSLSFVPAIEALGMIRDPAAAQELIRISDYLHPYDLSFVVDALKNHQYETQAIPYSNGKYTTYQVKRPAEQHWIDLRGYDVQTESTGN